VGHLHMGYHYTREVVTITLPEGVREFTCTVVLLLRLLEG